MFCGQCSTGESHSRHKTSRRAQAMDANNGDKQNLVQHHPQMTLTQDVRQDRNAEWVRMGTPLASASQPLAPPSLTKWHHPRRDDEWRIAHPRANVEQPRIMLQTTNTRCTPHPSENETNSSSIEGKRGYRTVKNADGTVTRKPLQLRLPPPLPPIPHPFKKQLTKQGRVVQG